MQLTIASFAPYLVHGHVGDGYTRRIRSCQARRVARATCRARAQTCQLCGAREALLLSPLQDRSVSTTYMLVYFKILTLS